MMDYPENRKMVNESYEDNRRLPPRQRFLWRVTRPDGKSFTIRASEWLMETYYQAANWHYERIGVA